MKQIGIKATLHIKAYLILLVVTKTKITFLDQTFCTTEIEAEIKINKYCFPPVSS